MSPVRGIYGMLEAAVHSPQPLVTEVQVQGGLGFRV